MKKLVFAGIAVFIVGFICAVVYLVQNTVDVSGYAAANYNSHLKPALVSDAGEVVYNSTSINPEMKPILESSSLAGKVVYMPKSVEGCSVAVAPVLKVGGTTRSSVGLEGPIKVSNFGAVVANTLGPVRLEPPAGDVAK